MHLHLELDHAPEMVGLARRAAVQHVRASWPGLDGLGDLVEDVALVTSEIVGNAVRHGEPPLSVDVDTVLADGHHVVTVTCHDGGPWDGTPPVPDSGRGLVLVRALVSGLTIDADAEGSTVIAVLTR